jgi:hypothetical protein
LERAEELVEAHDPTRAGSRQRAEHSRHEWRVRAAGAIARRLLADRRQHEAARVARVLVEHAPQARRVDRAWAAIGGAAERDADVERAGVAGVQHDQHVARTAVEERALDVVERVAAAGAASLAILEHQVAGLVVGVEPAMSGDEHEHVVGRPGGRRERHQRALEGRGVGVGEARHLVAVAAVELGRERVGVGHGVGQVRPVVGAPVVARADDQREAARGCGRVIARRDRIGGADRERAEQSDGEEQDVHDG